MALDSSNKQGIGCGLPSQCDECLAKLSSQLGLPDADGDIYVAIKTIATNVATFISNNTSLVTEEGDSIIFEGDGTASSPLRARLSEGAVVSSDGSLLVEQDEETGVIDISTLPLETSDTTSVRLSGQGTADDPLEASLAPGAITSLAGTLSVVQQPNGTYNLEAVGAGASVIHQDSASIALIGDGVPLSPLEANLTPGAITSTGGTVIVIPQPNGTINLEGTGIATVATTSNAAIQLSGDGTLGTPLGAGLTPGAITSTNGSVTVAQQPNGTFNLGVTPGTTSVSVLSTASVTLGGNGAGVPLQAALAPGSLTSTDGSVTVAQQPNGTFDFSVTPVAAPITITSPDNSINVVTPAIPGDPYELEVATTFTGSPSVAVTPTPGSPPDYSFALTPTALIPSPNPALTPVNVLFSGGQFQLGVLPAAAGVLPNTIVVGGTIGATPSATTLSAALGLLPPAIPVDSPWTLLICPGTYTEVGTLVVPVNVNLVALERGSVNLDVDLDFTYTGSTDYRLVLLGLRLLGSVTLTTTAKIGGGLEALFSGCTFVSASSLIFFARVLAGDLLLEHIILENCYFLGGSAITTTGAIVAKTCRILSAIAISSSGLLQAVGCTLAALTCNIAGRLFALSCALGGAWTCVGNGICIITSCLVNKATSAVGVIAWTLLNSSATAIVSIRDTSLVHVVTRLATVPLTWSIDCPNLLPGAGGVDRLIDVTLLDVPAGLLLPTITANLSVPLLTPLTAAVGAPPAIQPSVTTMVVTGLTTGILASLLSTVSSIILNNTSLIPVGTNNVNIKITPPITDIVNWYV